MLKRFVFEREDRPSSAWLARFTAGRAEAERWYLGEGRANAPTAAECRAALTRHMPELVPHYDRACALVGDDELAHRMLSHYRPPPLIFGCSQAIWLGARRWSETTISRSTSSPTASRRRHGAGARSSPRPKGPGAAASTA